MQLALGWLILSILCLIICYNMLNLSSDGFIGKTAFIALLPIFLPILAVGGYSGLRAFGYQVKKY